jgi:hypothetical protein
MTLLRPALLSLFTALPFAIGAPDARAACYEIIGCPDTETFHQRDLRRMSCQVLADIRNGIYAEHGYCFRKLQYQRQYGNKDCRYTASGQVPLSARERANVAEIARAERAKRCDG